MTTPQIMEQAAEWFVRLKDDDPGPEDCAAWCAWIEDPRHRDAFARIQASWDIAGAARSPAWPAPHELSGIRSRRGLLLALAAGVAAAVVGIQLFWGGNHLSTGRGQQQSALLEDGSRIELGALTGVDVRYTDRERLIVAKEGESYYQVARDPGRPFVVESGPVRIIALGTAFALRREGDAVSVFVTEGRVEVRPTSPASEIAVVRAEAGERVRLKDGTLLRTESQLAVGGARPGRLQFEEDPLSIVVASVNRYSAVPIEISDAALGRLEFTGSIFEGSIDRWLESLEVVFPARVVRAGGKVRIVPAGK